MKHRLITALSLTAMSVALALPACAQSDPMPQPDATAQQPVTAAPGGQREANRMVPAQVALKDTLDSTKSETGKSFKTELSANIRLSDGTELPKGTMLLGMVTNDDMNLAGVSKLALRFTEADLKNGQSLPIRATIVNYSQPEVFDNSGNSVAPGQQMTNTWTDQTLQIDQIGVAKDVDLHSKVASKNSGVFVATNGKKVVLGAGSEFAIAIAPAHRATASN